MRQHLPVLSLVRAWRVLPQAFGLLREAAPREFALSGALLMLAGLIPALMGFAAKLLVDELSRGAGLTPRVWELVGAQLLLALIGSASRYAGDWAREALRNKLQQHLRLRVAEHAASLDLAFFELPGNYDAFAKARDDLNWRPFMMAYALLFAAMNFAGVLGFFAAALAFQPLLALALALSALPTLFAAGKSGAESWSSHDLTTPEGRKAAYAEEVLTGDAGAGEVRLYGLAPTLLAQMRTYAARVLAENLRVSRNRARRFVLADAASVLVQYAALAFVVAQVALGRATLGDFTLLVAALAGVRSGLTQALANLGEVVENSLFFGDLTAFLAQQPGIAAPASPKPVPAAAPGLALELALENVSFAYPGAERKVFDGLSLQLRAGETTALVGVNGAGKTTLVKLLTRLYDPQGGRVLLGGADVRSFEPREYRARLGVILQDFARYQLSARENVAFGRAGEAADASRLKEAARNAGALDLIEHLPEGWDTLLGRQFHVRGQDLSGGQWQRIALARALYRGAPVLLLDEPTSALDAEAEAELFARYKELMRGRTTLLITHRFGTVRMADRIVVLEHGRVVEDGTHEQLLRRGGRYASMFTAQAAAYVTPGSPGDMASPFQG